MIEAGGYNGCCIACFFTLLPCEHVARSSFEHWPVNAFASQSTVLGTLLLLRFRFVVCLFIDVLLSIFVLFLSIFFCFIFIT